MIKALVVEDERMIREGIVSQVDWSSFDICQIESAANAEEALDLATAYLPDIVISDIRMKGMNGVELCTKLKEINPDLQIIFISGYSDKDYLISAINLKAVKYIEKPVSLEELNQTLTECAEIIRKRENEKRGLFRSLLTSQDYIKNNRNIHSFVTVIYQKEKNPKERLCLANYIKDFLHNFPSLDFMIDFIGDFSTAVLFYSTREEELTKLLNDYNFWSGILNHKTGDIFVSQGQIVKESQNVKTSFNQAMDSTKAVSYKGWNTIFNCSEDFGQTENFICNKIKEYIGTNYANRNLSVQSVADSVFMSVPYISSLFKKNTGTTIGQYIQNFRLEKAMEYLKDPQYKIYQIADMVGYDDAHYFAKLFRKATGSKPSEYRNLFEL